MSNSLQAAMTPDAFTRSVSRRTPPAALAPALQALWWVAKDDWERAHNIVIAHEGRDCAWVHAHLHRGEGDLPNARWWYKEARKPVQTGPLAAEWNAIARELLSESKK